MSTFKANKLLNTCVATLIVLGAASCAPSQTTESTEQILQEVPTQVESAETRTENEFVESKDTTQSEAAPAVGEYANDEPATSEEAIADRTYTYYTGVGAYSIKLPDDFNIDADDAPTTGRIVAENYTAPERGQASTCFDNSLVKTEIKIVEAAYTDRVNLWSLAANAGASEVVEQSEWQAKGIYPASRLWTSGADEPSGCNVDIISTLIKLSSNETLEVISYFGYGDRTHIDTIEAIHNSIELHTNPEELDV